MANKHISSTSDKATSALAFENGLIPERWRQISYLDSVLFDHIDGLVCLAREDFEPLFELVPGLLFDSYAYFIPIG